MIQAAPRYLPLLWHDLALLQELARMVMTFAHVVEITTPEIGNVHLIMFSGYDYDWRFLDMDFTVSSRNIRYFVQICCNSSLRILYILMKARLPLQLYRCLSSPHLLLLVFFHLPLPAYR